MKRSAPNKKKVMMGSLCLTYPTLSYGNNTMKNVIIRYKKKLAIGIVILMGSILAFIILRMEKITVEEPHEHAAGEHEHEHENDNHAKGPHGGRLLSEGRFQVEIIMHEQGTPPLFWVHVYDKGKVIDPDMVKLTIELHRLGGKVDVINFKSESDHLCSDRIIEEPHSFDVAVVAEYNGHVHRWEYSQIEGRIELTPEAIQSAGIVVETAGSVPMKSVLELPGEIELNADKVVHVVPRVSGVVTEVNKNLGDTVSHGEVIAVLDSREVAELKSGYMASVKRAELARATFERKERLWKQKISSERDYLVSRQALAEEEINLQTATQKLLALGFSQTDLDSIPEMTGRGLTRYELKAQFDGIVIKKEIAVGEAIKADADIYAIADLRTVWVGVTVYAKDLSVVRVGQNVTARSKILGLEANGTLTYLGPLVGEQTRTAQGRVVIQNPEGRWRPGLFVTVEIVQEEVTVPVAVSVDAIQTFRDVSVVFVQYDNVFEVRPLELGRNDGRWVEVVRGLSPGERYVARNSFILKADLGKAGATHEH
ncbi:MAG: efflux transporter protein [Candidatus Brocadia fulgida]|uniref:Efflux transporter protein n=1 Tax=Candidatus Brocadia fulgida TaxID=380242 RepID=A0A0M2V3I1_9BACT|nr:MAG: efflux transporter protein [Candidatus Brocadia fulgida]